MNKIKRNSKTGKSIVWKYYVKKDIFATCNMCTKSIKHAGNTTNLMQHLQRKHLIYLKSENERQIKNIENNANDQEIEIVETEENEEDIDDPVSTPKVTEYINISFIYIYIYMYIYR